MDKKGLTLLILFVVIAAGVIGSIAFTLQSKTEGMTCKTTGPTHEVVIKDDKATPNVVSGNLCDKLKITNEDNVTREIGFGQHEHHTPYDGVTERVLHQGESLTVTMSEKGTHGFHDHFHDEVAATFTVH